MKNNNSVQCKECDCNEFVTKPNRYDVYESNESGLTMIRSEHTQEEDQLYCRNCSNPLEHQDKTVLIQ